SYTLLCSNMWTWPKPLECQAAFCCLIYFLWCSPCCGCRQDYLALDAPAPPPSAPPQRSPRSSVPPNVLAVDVLEILKYLEGRQGGWQ
uniref:Uncharacterized protein n=1 Tax=Scleropages formosus TaxID=113540 RepID=A0A8C9WSD6_SCLFO